MTSPHEPDSQQSANNWPEPVGQQSVHNWPTTSQLSTNDRPWPIAMHSHAVANYSVDGRLCVSLLVA